MSPEQAQGHPLDQRSDLYSMGVTFYHMLAGEPPFKAETPLALAMKHVKDTPVSLAVYRPIPPGDRYRSCSRLMATRTKRILSVQNVSDGGGSEKALIRMIRRLDADGWDCHVAIGGPPRLAAEYAAAGATVHVVAMERITTSGGFGRWPR